MRKFILAAALVAVSTQGAQADKCPSKVPAEAFTEAFLSDEANIAAGKDIWLEQCTHCHGKKAYPGKAPKLKPKKYKTGFVYRRVACGLGRCQRGGKFTKSLR